MNYQGQKVDFPAKIELNFDPFARELESKRDAAKEPLKTYYDSVLQQFENNPWLRSAFDPQKLENQGDLLEDIMQVAFPPILTNNEIKALVLPLQFIPFYKSNRLEKMLAHTSDDFSFEFMEYSEKEIYISACSSILALYYNHSMPASRPNYINIPDHKTGKIRCFRMTINADYLDIKPKDKAPEITEEDLIELIDNFENFDLWKKKFPTESWIFSGCIIISLVDVTVDNIIKRITNDLLNANDESFVKLQEDISRLLEIDVKMSFAGLKGTKVFQENPHYLSLMLGKEESMNCTDDFCGHALTELMEKKKFLAIPSIKKFHVQSQSKLSQNLMDSGLKSYFACLISYNGIDLGFFELGSYVTGALNTTIPIRLAEVIPLLAVAGYRMQQEQKNRVEAAIQEEYTSLHPSVKWKFEEEANHFIISQNSGNEYQLRDLSFKDVYPLYGQLDIRGSSTIRNTAVKNDLLSQLLSAKKLVELASSQLSLLVYDELEYVINEFIKNLNIEMAASSEQEILLFLNNEFESTLEHHTKGNPTLRKAFDEYKSSLHPDLHFIYNERKQFDQSVNAINKSLAKYIDEKQLEAQAMFPHYFERYKTDGLEFNIYIGESISPDHGFHISHVNNLRLWQLSTMLEMERMYKKEQKDSETPLEVASLILAFSNSLSIQFRMDEKRFDVEGAYNARYEIIKKRIDKAHIKGTKDRITQAGKMVVVYANDNDEQEYLRYFKFLRGKGMLKNEEPEQLLLENLQGVTGLKALRVGINYDEAGTKKGMTIEEIMKDMEGVEKNN